MNIDMASDGSGLILGNFMKSVQAKEGGGPVTGPQQSFQLSLESALQIGDSHTKDNNVEPTSAHLHTAGNSVDIQSLTTDYNVSLNLNNLIDSSAYGSSMASAENSMNNLLEYAIHRVGCTYNTVHPNRCIVNSASF